MNRKLLATKIAAGTATPEELQAAGADLVLSVKRDENVTQTRLNASPVVQKGGKDSRTLSFIASTEAVDRMGDIIRVKGWDLTHYRQNPVALFQHNADWPIGTAKVRKGELPGGKKALFSDITFASAEASPMAEQVFQLTRERVLRGNSVGFIGRKASRPESAEEREALGLGEYGVVFEKSELVEDSVVSVPANPEAVTLGLRSLVTRGLLTQDQADLFAHDALSVEPGEVFDNVRRSVFDFGDITATLQTLADDIDDEEEETTGEGAPEGDAVAMDPGKEFPADDDEDDDEEEDAEDKAAMPDAPPSDEDEEDDDDEDEDADKGGDPMPDDDDEDDEDEDDDAKASLDHLVRELVAVRRENAAALRELAATNTETANTLRQLGDTLNDLARKVLDLNVTTPKAGTGARTGGDGDIDITQLSGALDELAARARAIRPTQG